MRLAFSFTSSLKLAQRFLRHSKSVCSTSSAGVGLYEGSSWCNFKELSRITSGSRTAYRRVRSIVWTVNRLFQAAFARFEVYAFGRKLQGPSIFSIMSGMIFSLLLNTFFE